MSQIPNLFQNYRDPLNPVEISVHSWGSDWTRVFASFESSLLLQLHLSQRWPSLFTDMDLALLLLAPWKSPTPGFGIRVLQGLGDHETRHSEVDAYTDCPSLALFLLSLWPLWGQSFSPSWDIYIKQYPLGSGCGWWGVRWMGSLSFHLLQVSILSVKASYFPESNFGASWLMNFNIHLCIQ